MKNKATLIKIYPFTRRINDTLNYDSLLIWYRDEFGEKKMRFVERAQIPYYIIKDKDSQEAQTPPMFIEKDKVEKVLTYSDSIHREIAMKTNSLKYYDDVIMSPIHSNRNLNNLFKHNWIYDADMDISDRYIKAFHEEFDNDISYKLHKCYYDIEVDTMPNGFQKNRVKDFDPKFTGYVPGQIGYMGFPREDLAPCPINIITLYDAKEIVSYSFILNNELNKSQLDFKQNEAQEVQKIKDLVLEMDKISLNNVVIKYFDAEEDLIEDFFKVVHNINPDICLGWNSRFDLQTMINRLVYLYSKKKEYRGMNKDVLRKKIVASRISDSNYNVVKNSKGEDVYITPELIFKKSNADTIPEQIDELKILDAIVWMDQMRLYANVRKADLKNSYKLNDIAYDEVKTKKLDYTGYTIKNMAWLDWSKFTRYNIQDVIVEDVLEKKLLDCEMLQSLSDITNTRKYQVFKKTVCIKNFVSKYAEDQGFIMNNNKNASYGSLSEEFTKNYLNNVPILENNKVYLEAFEKKENYGA